MVSGTYDPMFEWHQAQPMIEQQQVFPVPHEVTSMNQYVSGWKSSYGAMLAMSVRDCDYPH
jgi:hypothetical protein